MPRTGREVDASEVARAEHLDVDLACERRPGLDCFDLINKGPDESEDAATSTDLIALDEGGDDGARRDQIRRRGGHRGWQGYGERGGRRAACARGRSAGGGRRFGGCLLCSSRTGQEAKTKQQSAHKDLF